jgi:hypothetical protein
VVVTQERKRITARFASGRRTKKKEEGREDLNHGRHGTEEVVRSGAVIALGRLWGWTEGRAGGSLMKPESCLRE